MCPLQGPSGLASCKLRSEHLVHPIKTSGGVWLSATGTAAWEAKFVTHPKSSQGLCRLGGSLNQVYIIHTGCCGKS